MTVQTADEFYTTMGTLTHEMLGSKLVDADNLIKYVYAMAQMPFTQLSDLREKYTYNITPFTAAMSTGQKPQKPGINIFSDEDDFDEDDFVENINCFTGMFPPQVSPSRRLGDVDMSQSASSFDISKISPGAYGAQSEVIGPLPVDMERMTLDMTQLKKQYKRLRQRQNQAHIILAAASAKHNASKGGLPTKVLQKTKRAAVAPIHTPVAVNHLFIGRQLLEDERRNKAVTSAPHIAPYYPKNNLIATQIRPKSQSENADGYQFRITKDGIVVPDTEGYTRSRRKLSTARSVSNESSGSGTSTLQSSEHSDIASDGSTFGLDSDVALSDVESLAAADLPDLIDLGIEMDESDKTGDELPEAEDPDQVTVDNQSESSGKVDDSSFCESTESDQGVDDTNEINLSENDASSDSELDIIKEVKSNKPPSPVCSVSLDTSVSKTSDRSSHETSKQSVVSKRRAYSSHPRQSTSQTKSDDSHSGSEHDSSRERITDPEAHYVASLTSKAQKGNHSHHSQPTSNSTPSSSQLHSNNVKSVTLDNVPMRAPKLFNPFPGQHLNSRRMQNGVKLGLYSANNVPKLETGIMKPPGVKTIGRAQINACLHRQYMEEIKQQARSSTKS